MKKYTPLLLLIPFLFIYSCNDDGDDFSGPTYLNPNAAVEERVADLLSQMTLEEKVGQMTQIERQNIELTTIKDNFLGSILNGGGSSPGDSPTAWADMYDQFQEQALATRLGIPIIFGTDAVHGHNNVKGATIFPHNIGLGCTRNPDLIEEISRITAVEVAATGIDWTFAPAIPVTRNERWGRTYEGFGETAELAVMMAGPAVRGYQGDDLSDGRTIAACAKHFIGDGGTTNGVDRGNTQVDEATLRALHLPGYIEAIEANVATVMGSYSSWNGQKVHGSKALFTDLLKDELGFEGFVISDWAAINELPGTYRQQIVASVNAGFDMIMVPDDYETFIPTLTSAIEAGEIPMERVDDAVSRILKVKFELGLFENPMTDRSLFSEIGSDEHRAVARQAVRESMVLLKNENAVLPISKSAAKVHVSGRFADNLGFQLGGWSIFWQGGSGDITEGTSILEGIREVYDGEVTFNEQGFNVAGADVAIAVIGEEPYAEGAGDRDDLSLSLQDVNVVRNLKATGVPVVVIIVCGRPLIIDDILENADAIIAAWLPGTEGDGVADVVFGDYAPTGKLSNSWPRTMEQVPINVGDPGYDPLYEYGYGLTY